MAEPQKGSANLPAESIEDHNPGMIGTTMALWRLLRIALYVGNVSVYRVRELLVAPILKDQVDAGLLNGPKIFRVAGHKRQPKPYRDSSNEGSSRTEPCLRAVALMVAAAR
jgi:hypothetical protein